MTPKRSILIVGEDAVSRILTKWFLGTMGYEVRTSASSGEGLQMLAKKPAQFLVTDLFHPGSGGVSLARLVRIRFPSTILILRTEDPPKDVSMFDDLVSKTTHVMGVWELLERHLEEIDANPGGTLPKRLPIDLERWKQNHCAKVEKPELEERRSG